ncbi:geranylgeranylglycerol-phosphate geranylgeranyltransferase [Polaribacter pectinis]|uniref:Geranylgeranylglycerol-phosphate geranylgeranyltransferase n=1 Tax=Polaribacter pectinis TaxID=2738844 RepID=A0A7G9LCT4_9FLAO|nr:geranylgeranylglycerol-phosphate geranylgeranyltransferase [Polaribacter pectinis]QNM86433.1 geranylgeranylglycerol-phosphate geranylgeranyltransferase [Polaribacter pectinis]
MISFLKLIRYKNLLMVLLTMVLTKYALLDSIFISIPERNYQFSILIFSVIFIMAGGYIVNDIYDIEIDKINKPNKVFIDNIISKKNAWKVYFLLTSIGLLLGFYLSFFEGTTSNSLYFLLIIFILFVYSKYLKKTFFLGNLAISFCLSMVIYITYVFTSEAIIYSESLEEFVVYKINHHDILGPVLAYSFFAFLTTLVREIIKDIEDINGDLKLNAKTLPIIIGRNRSSMVAIFFTVILLIIIIIILHFFENEVVFISYAIAFIIIPLIYVLFKLLSAEKKKDFSKLSSLMKLIMLFGILSMLLFTIQ